MTNFEYYKDEIKKIVNANKTIAVRDGKIVACAAIRCNDCKFKSTNDSFVPCENRMLLWLYEEHKETPKLTAKEYSYLSFLKKGYMVRSKGVFGEDIRVYCNKPNAGITFADRSISWYGNKLKALINADMRLFDFIKLDNEPYSIEEMLTWEHEVE
nr:MAG TPA: hypothetical protein [Caudoviricetes sp.]